MRRCVFMKKLLALFMCLTIIASCASVSVCAAEIENLAGGPFDFENDIAPFTNATVVDKDTAGVDFASANGSNVLKLTGGNKIKFSDVGISSGVIVFTVDYYVCNTYKTIDSENNTVVNYDTGTNFKISNDSNDINLLNITRASYLTFASACGGWTAGGVNYNPATEKWYTLKFTVNVNENDSAENGYNSWYEVAYKESDAADSTYKNFELQHMIPTGTEQVKRYVLDGYTYTGTGSGSGNNNKTMIEKPNAISFTINSKLEHNYLDNLSIKAYEPFYTAINNCTTADEVKTQLKLYKNLGIFDFGSEYTKVDDMNTVFSTLVGKNFSSDAAVTNAYNAAVAANVNPYISERIVMDDLTESPIFSNGSLVTDTTIKSDGKFYMPAYSGTVGVNFANSVKKDGIIKFKSDVYVHYDNATRITPFAIRMGSNNNTYSNTGEGIASITRSGSFAAASSAWTQNASVKDKEWSNIEYLVDTEAESLRIKADGKEALMQTSYNDYSTNTIANSYVYKYTGETIGGAENKNNMGTIPDTIYGLRFSHGENGGKDTSLDYLANTDITVYKPLYKAINEAEDAESLAKAIDFYSNELKVFTKSNKEYSAEELYNALKGKTYSSSKEFADAYNNYVSTPVLTLGNITFNNGYPRYTNIMVNTTSFTLKKDAISYVALYAADGSLNGVYELPRITSEKTAGDGQRTYTYGDCITILSYDNILTNDMVIINKTDWNNAATAKVFIWSKDSDGSAIIPVANSVKIK